MQLGVRELWTVVHGLVLGTLFLLAFAGGFAGFYSLRPEWVTVVGVRERLRRLLAGSWIMAVVAWLTVITGTWIVYPWYRQPQPDSPRSFLLGDPSRAGWHTFGMEWKEHIAFIAPILATAVAFAVTYYREELAHREDVRRAALVLFTIAFLSAGVAGVFGAFINKVAPIR